MKRVFCALLIFADVITAARGPFEWQSGRPRYPKYASKLRQSAKNSCGYEKMFKEVRNSPHFLNGLQIIEKIAGKYQGTCRCSEKCLKKGECWAFVVREGYCILLHPLPWGKNSYIYSSGDRFYAYIGINLSVLGYRITSGVDGDPIALYNDNSYVSPDADIFTAVDPTVTLNTTYKSALLDYWNTFNVVRVNLAFLKEDNTVGSVAFDARESTSKYDWMVQEKLLGSGWNDLTTTTKTSRFGVFGSNTRRFNIMDHRGCSSDVLWLSVVTKDPCGWTANNPQIIYSPLSTGYPVNNSTILLITVNGMKAGEARIYQLLKFQVKFTTSGNLGGSSSTKNENRVSGAILRGFCCGSKYEKLFQEVRNSPHYLNGIQIVDKFNVRSRVCYCARACLKNHLCTSYVRRGPYCILLCSTPFGKTPYIYSKKDRVYAYRGAHISVLAYRVQSDVDGDAFVRYNDNSYVSSDADTVLAVDLSVTLNKTYKSALLDNWNTFNVVGVYLGFVRPDNSMGKVSFDARESTSKYNWMVKNKLLSSPWYVLSPSTPTDFFGVIGRARRRFYILDQRGCSRDFLWLAVVPSGDPCAWGTGYKNPEIIYSPLSTGYPVNNRQPGKASTLVVVMKLEMH